MIFGFDKEELIRLNAYHTCTEILQQPHMWIETYRIIERNKEEISKFLKRKADKETRIIFTGAGTSDYIGDTIRSYVEGCTGIKAEAIATTDIVANPQEVIERDKKTLLVSFARSGNSPESIGAFQIMQEHTRDIAHVVITCNKYGNLAKIAAEERNGYVILLPEETNDKGFAMTSSFSCMMLAALLFFDIDRLEENKKYVDIVAKQGEKILNERWEYIKDISGGGPQRVVYLGTGCFRGLSQELALKNMELTNGRIATIQETILGFRHGPKTFMDKHTDIIVLMSQNSYTNKYIKDLIREIYSDSGKGDLIVLSLESDEEIRTICNHYIVIGGERVPEIYTAFYYLLFGQMFALFNSISLGIESDNPSPDGTVNRVVKGVTLHNYAELVI